MGVELAVGRRETAKRKPTIQENRYVFAKKLTWASDLFMFHTLVIESPRKRFSNENHFVRVCDVDYTFVDIEATTIVINESESRLIVWLGRRTRPDSQILVGFLIGLTDSTSNQNLVAKKYCITRWQPDSD